MIEIEKNIPLPLNLSDLPFVRMEIGDSFLVKYPKGKFAARKAMRIYMTKHGGKFISRSVEGGLRIWRTE